MQNRRITGDILTTILLAVGGWGLHAIYAVTIIILQDYARQRFNPLYLVILWQLATALGWLVLTPVILWLTRAFPLGGAKWKRNIIVHIVAGLVIVLTRQAIDAFVQPLLGFPPGKELSYFEVLRYLFISDFHFSVITYCIVLGLIFGTRYYRQLREREVQTLQLEARLAQARMHVLKMQLQPHFLFNTHNAISELIYKDPEAAERMLGNLSDLLRLSLVNLEIEEIPLKQELDFLNKYLEIEQTRFRHRLRVKFRIEPETTDAVVPNMILQPLVENAIKHGISPAARGGTVEVSAFRENRNVCLIVADDGIGVPFGNPAEIAEGVGLTNIKARLANLYGAKHVFQIGVNGGKGFYVKLTIPFKKSKNPSGAFKVSKQFV